MHERLQPILDILDEGLRIYRRGFVGFLLLTAGGLVPAAIGMGLLIASAQFWDDVVTLLIAFGWMLLMLPLVMYLIGGLSRATLAVQRGLPVRPREVLAIGPLQMLGMGCYSVVFYIVANIVSSIVVLLCFCPFYIAIIGLSSGIGVLVQDTTGFGFGLLFILSALIALIAVLFYGLSLVLGGATYSGLVYGLQPFVQDRLSLGRALQHSIDLLFYRFGYNLLAFLLASFIFGATAVVVTVAIGVLVPLPLIFALGEDSIIAQGVSASAWILGLIMVVPPMPIWMALLYQQNLALWQGRDLAERIAVAGRQVSPVDGQEAARTGEEYRL